MMHLHNFFFFTDRFTLGQNLAIIWSTAQLNNYVTFSSRIQNWFNEVQKYAWGARWSAKTGHYSQVNYIFFYLFHIFIP